MQRGSLTIWMDEQAIKPWHCQTDYGRRGRGLHYGDTAIETPNAQKVVQADGGAIAVARL